MVGKDKKDQEQKENRKDDVQINILGHLDLKTRRYEPSPAEMEALRRDNPLQAALYSINAGKIDEAKGLIQTYQDQLKAQVDGAMEEKYRSEFNALREQLDDLRKQRKLDQEQIAKLHETLQKLIPPPFSRAVLIEAFRASLKPEEQIIQLRAAIITLEALRPILNEGRVDEVLALLRAKLEEMEQAAGAPATQDRPAGDASGEQADSAVSPQPLPAYRAVIAVGGSRYEVNVAADEPLSDLDAVRGREVWTLGPAMNVFKIGDEYPTGTAAEVVKRIDDRRLHVKRRGDEEFVVQMTPRLAAVEELEAGDLVRVLPEAELGLDLLEKATKKLTLDELPTERYEDIGGLDDQIKVIKEAVELPFMYRTVYRQFHLKRPKGILLYGPPGCGKTMVAKAIAKSLYDQTEKSLKDLKMALTLWMELGQSQTTADALARTEAQIVGDETQTAFALPGELQVSGDLSVDEARRKAQAFLDERQIKLDDPEGELRRVRNRLQEGPGNYFLSIKGPELLSKWVGESEYSIRRIFAIAREKATQETPVVLFFDEMESMFSRRGSGRSSDMEKTIVPQLLAEIDGIDAMPNVLVIGASNRYDLIDPAVLRPGRLDVKIRIDRPNKVAARDIMSKYLTPQLPIDEHQVREAGSLEQAIQALITKTVDVIYSSSSQLVIIRKASRETPAARSKPISKPLTEIVSGAMLANVVERAKRGAAQRAVNSKGTGISWADDLRLAIKRECEESKDQYLFEARDEAGEMAYRDVDLYEAQVFLDETAAGGRPMVSWATLKARPWFMEDG